MKKTLTVNLNNIVFHIDDDAYEMLHTYLSEIADHFQSDEEKTEIMNDIEARIAELFTEKLQKNKNVVSLIDVQEIIEIMGKPSQYADEDEDVKAPKAEKKQQHKSRRFYRDPETAILGGVASGLAAYIGWDVTLIRVLLVVLAFASVGNFILIYIVVWFIAPPALTATQRLEMQGENVTVDSIKTELNNAKNYVESDKFKQTTTTFGEKFLEILRLFFKVVFGFIGGLLGLVGILLVGVLLFLLFFFIFEPSLYHSFAPGIVSNWAFITPENTILFIISLILVVGCPIFMLVYWAIRIVSGRRSHSRTASWVVFILWLAGLFMLSSISAKAAFNFRNNNGEPFSISWNDDKTPLVDEVRVCEPFHSIEIMGNMKLIVKQDSVQKLTVSSDSEYLPNIVTEVENGVLKIHSNKIFLNRTINVYISADSIRSIVAKGACCVESESQLVYPDFSLSLVGASSADMDVKVAGLFQVEVKGASSVKLTGSCNTLKIDAVGASSTDAYDLIAKNVEVYAAGASNAQVYAIDKLDAQAFGASDIDCHGNPRTTKKITHVGSSIEIE